MYNNTNSHNLSTFGWNFSFVGNIKLSTDSDGNVYIFNLGIESIFSQQSSSEESDSSTYSLNSQQFLQPYSSNQRIFQQQADGSYEDNGGTLTWNADHYELEEANGSKIVFRSDGQLNYVEYSNDYRLSAGYTDNLLTELKDSNQNSFAINYNSDGRVEAVADGTGQVNAYSYDATGQYLLSIEDVNGTTSFSYDNPFDPTVVSSITYGNGSKVSYDYDQHGRLQQIIYGEGRESISYVYNESGEITSVTDANGEQLVYKYDDNGRLISQQIAGSERLLSYSYGNAGEVTVTDADGATVKLSASEQGLILRQSDILSRLTQFQYDEQGNLTGINAGEQFGVSYSYDEQDNVTSRTNSLGHEVKFTYEPNSERLQTVTDARGNDLSYSYNEQGYLTAITYEDGSSENFSVDEQGNTVESVNRRGIAIGYEYNTQGQVTRVDYQDGSADTYTYDDTGRLTSTTDARGTTSIEYDADNPGLMAKISYPTGRSLAYTYDEVGRRIQMVDQNGSEVNYSYDAAGRLAGLTDETGGSVVSYTYNDAGRLVRENNGNGTYTTYSYDLAGQLLNLANYAADDSVNSSYVYTYDDLGRQTSVTDLDGEWIYEYDAASQLIGAVFTSTNPEIENQDLTYVYDAAGNRIRTIDNGVTTEYQTNDLNQYTNAGAVDYQYDLDGNLTYKNDGGNSWAYSYDDQDRLVSVLEANGSHTEYEYDIFGNRIATVYNGERTEYLVDPFGYGDVVSEYDGSGNLTAEYAHGIGLVSRTDSSNTAAYYDFNATGSVVGLTGSAGEVLNRYGYLPYGESLFESESIDNSFEFVGKWGIMEEANGLDFMRARYYSSSEGRFLNTDPIGLAGGDTNIYRYVNNNPINLIDPLGLWGIGLQANGGIGVGFGRNNGAYIGGDVKAGLFSESIGGIINIDAFDSRSDTRFITGFEAGVGAGGFFTTANSADELSKARKTLTLDLAIPLLPAGISFEVSLGENFQPIVTVTGSVGPGIAVSAKGSEGEGGFTLPGDIPLPRLPGRDANYDGINNPGIQIVPPPYTEEVEDGFEDAEDQVRRRYYDPLIMDLDGDGIELTSLETSKVYFDIDGDGFREKTGWVKSDDGLLVFDRNNDGYINDISELFGNQTISGFTELQELDSNNDGQITSTDTNFGDLQVWRDLDEDGRSDVNELFSLAELNITKIDVVGKPVNITREGHLITETGSFELADGTQLEVANVWMNLDQQDSYYDHNSTFNSPVVFTEQILNLPNLKGYGNLPDLRIAMAQDSELATLVESFTDSASSGVISAARELMRPILLGWAGIDETNNSSSFAQELAFLEKFVGRVWNNTRPSGAGIATIQNTFASLESELETRLLVQVVESSVGYNTRIERYEFSGNIGEAVEQFKQVVIRSTTDTSQILNFEAVALSEVIEQSVSDSNWVFNTFATNEDSALSVLTTDILGTDSDLEVSNLSFGEISDVVNGTAIINADGNIEFTPNADFNGTAIIEYTVTDGTKTLTGLARVNVAPVNDAPVASNDTVVTEEDTTITVLAAELFGNDSDIEGDALNISSIDNAVNGTAIIDADGNIEFTPDANFNGIATIDYTVSDGIDSDTASIEITVNSVNDAPLANNDTAIAIDEDTSITILAADLLGNDSDVEGDSLSIISVNSDNGTATLNAEGQIEFTPNANFNGTATFNYIVSDGSDSSEASVELVVNPVNDVLIANSDTVTTDEDTPITILASDLFANDVNDDIEKSLTISQLSNSTNGTAVIDAEGNVRFTPDANFKGIASFDYTVTEGTDSETTSVSVVVNSINDAPIANTDTATTNEDTPIVISAAELLGNDINLDPEDSLSLVSVNNAANGTVIINEDGNVEFTPDANFNGTASFGYVVTDGTVNDTASVEVVVNAINDAPILTAPIPNLTLAKNAANSVINLADYFEDVENGDNLAYQLGGTISSFQTNTGKNQFFDVFSIDNTKTLTLGYADNVAGTAAITVKVTDSANESVETTFNVSVVNSVPVANDDIATTDENATITISANELLGNDRDSDAVDTLSITRVRNSANGTAVINQDGDIEFTPAANFNGNASFEYVVTDGMDDATGLVSVEVNPVNNAPLAVEDTFATNEDTPVTISASELLSNDSDVEGDSLSFGGINNSINGTAVLNENGDIEFTPGADFNGTASFEYTVTDGSLTSTGLAQIDVLAVNDAPFVREAIPDLVVEKNAANSVINLADYFEDLEDGDNLAYQLGGTITSFQSSTGGNQFFDVFSIDSTKTLTLGYADGVTGTATVRVKVTDSGNESFETTFNVSVIDPNDETAGGDALTTANDTLTTDEDTPVTILAAELLSNDTGNNLSITGVNNAANGTVVIDELGNVEFTPDANFNGTASFDYTVSDGTENSTAAVEVIVNPVNDSVVANEDTITTDENTSITVLATELLSNDSDIEQNSLSLVSVNNAVNGTVVINNSGNVEFTPDANFNGTASFDYTVSDGSSNDTATVEVVVDAANLAPTLVNPIPDITVATNSPNSVIAIADYIEDLEDGVNLTYSFGASSSIQSSASGKFFDRFSFNSTTKSLILDYADGLIGTSTIRVRATDSANQSVETSFTVSVVESVEESPNEVTLSTVDDAIATDEDTPVTVLASELLGNDIGGNLSISSVNSPLGGTAILDEDGNVKFTPAANFYGNTSFEYTITDGNSTATGLVSVDVAAVNDAPILTQTIPNLVLTQNAPNSVIRLADYFEDAENGDNLGYSLRASSSIQSSTSGKFFDGFSLNGAKELTLNYADDVIGRSTITVKVSDGGTEFVETNFTVSVIDVDAQGDVLLGGDGNDYLVGKEGNDTINGGAGSDYLAGTSGSDRFVFNSPNEGVDTIADFSVEDDTLVFSAAGFGGNLTSGMLASQMFTVGTAATNSDHRFVYDAGSGDLSYDSDGTGENEQVKIASLNNGLTLTHNNFYVEL